MDKPVSLKRLLEDANSHTKIELYNPMMNKIAEYESKYDVDKQYLLCPAIIEHYDDYTDTLEIRIV